MKVGSTVGSARLADEDLAEDTAENAALYQTIAPGLPSDVEDRLREYVKQPWLSSLDLDDDDVSGDDLGFWLFATLLRDQLKGFETVALDTIQSQYVRHAEGQALDDIGEFVQTPRWTGEKDAHYRIRLKVQLRKYVGGATLAEIMQVAAVLLETEVSNLEVREPFETEAARVDIAIGADALDAAKIETADLIEFLGEVRAAGVRLTASVSGSFGYRSLEDYRSGVNNPDRAYNEAPYSGSIDS